MEKQKATEVGCQACKKSFTSTQKGLIILSIYVLLSSIYGTIELIKNLIEIFK